MDKQLSRKEQKALLDALKKAKEMRRKMEMREEEKRWAEIELPLTLADGLSRLTKDELSDIRSNCNIKGASALKKQELISVLAQHIPSLLPGLLNKMDETRYKMMKRIADSGGHAFLPLEPDQLAYFTKRGLIFSGTFRGKQTLAMPEEVLELFKKIDSASLRETIRRNTERIKLTQGMLFYYGTLGFSDLNNLIEQYSGRSMTSDDFLVLNESESFYREIRFDTEAYSNIRVWDADKVKKEHRSRPDLPFYPFTKSQLLLAGEPGFVDRNPCHQAFVDFIKKNYTISRDEADSLVEECVYAIRIGEAPGQLLEFLQSELEIDDLDTIKAFMDHIAVLHNNSRQWFIKGYTPNELSAAKNRKTIFMPPAKAAVVDFATRKPVGRNDPCPCGSGKKFKKCCGG